MAERLEEGKKAIREYVLVPLHKYENLAMRDQKEEEKEEKEGHPSPEAAAAATAVEQTPLPPPPADDPDKINLPDPARSDSATDGQLPEDDVPGLAPADSSTRTTDRTTSPGKQPDPPPEMSGTADSEDPAMATGPTPPVPRKRQGTTLKDRRKRMRELWLTL